MSAKSNQHMLREALRFNEWKEDKFGHFHKLIEGRKHRVKFQASSARVEARSSEDTFWIKKSGEYFVKMTIDENHIIVGHLHFELPPTK